MITPRSRPASAARAAVAAALIAACVAGSFPAALAQAPPPLPAAAAPAAITRPPPTSSVGATECGVCGKVESIRQTTSKQQWTPLGTGVGVGGVPDLGDAPAGVTSYRIGPGLSNQGMVVLGSAGGAAYKNTPNSYERLRWEVTVKLDGGGVRIVSLSYEPYVHEGDRVRVSGNNVELLE